MEENSPEHRVAMAVRNAFEGLDTLIVLAADPETTDLIEAEKIMIGQLVTRATLLGSFLLARHSSKLRIVQNG